VISTTKMTVGDVSTPAGLKSLNEALRERSYLEGYAPSQADTAAFNALKGAPGSDLPHALRWYNHIKSFGDLRNQFPGSAPAAAPKAAAPADDDDDVDLFGSDDENDEEAEKLKQQRLAEYAAKKEKKPGPIAKSSVVLDVKPWDDETDMKEMEKLVRSIEKDGLVWGASKLVPSDTASTSSRSCWLWKTTRSPLRNSPRISKTLRISSSLWMWLPSTKSKLKSFSSFPLPATPRFIFSSDILFSFCPDGRSSFGKSVLMCEMNDRFPE